MSCYKTFENEKNKAKNIKLKNKIKYIRKHQLILFWRYILVLTYPVLIPNLKGRDKTRVVQYRCPGNTAVQVNNYLDKTARVAFGPDLIILGPHENFTVLSLSGEFT